MNANLFVIFTLYLFFNVWSCTFALLTLDSYLVTGGANRPGESIENGVARAVRLAANLSNQLFVDLPPSLSEAATAAASGASASAAQGNLLMGIGTKTVRR